ncbi:hypothetical protein [Kribbella sp. CA-293567]|uniref:hypothetical protein n=1 Tax=Kribbella sp. CA-293567 TaxID=3002436 RepID=UPI0022DD6E1F|nr:hypothetical protein [Kribbella sp. CA-293567]WBQ08063.1 hypothetical protein OX958_14950 [Kribbella sp. CA-293567]
MAVVTMGVGTLTACSGGDYCGELKSYAETSKNLKDLKDKEAVEKLTDEAKKLSKSAPDDLKDDWKVMNEYLAKAKDANGDQAKLAELGKEAGPKLVTAGEAITKQAKDTCQITLGA